MRGWVDALNAWHQHSEVPLAQILGEVQLFSSTEHGTRALNGMQAHHGGDLFSAVEHPQTPDEYVVARQPAHVVDDLADDFGAVSR
jgi:hypothetical protein